MTEKIVDWDVNNQTKQNRMKFQSTEQGRL